MAVRVSFKVIVDKEQNTNEESIARLTTQPENLHMLGLKTLMLCRNFCFFSAFYFGFSGEHQ